MGSHHPARFRSKDINFVLPHEATLQSARRFWLAGGKIDMPHCTLPENYGWLVEIKYGE